MDGIRGEARARAGAAPSGDVELGGDGRGSPRPSARGSAPGGRYTEAERAALLAAYESSGQTQRDFCAQHGVSTATLNAWRRAARQATPAARTARGRGRRSYGPDEKRRAVEALEKSGLTVDRFARTWGVSPKSLSRWVAQVRRGGPKALEGKKPGRPKGSGKGSKLPVVVQGEILRTKLRFPDFGRRKLVQWLARFRGMRASEGSVGRVLAERGVPEAPRPKRKRAKRQPPRRFERARPGELWQTDITSYVLRRHHLRVYLTVFLDDYSRYVVGWALEAHQKSELVTTPLLEAIGRYGKPREVLSDQGRQYFAWRGKSAFQKLLAREGIAHVVARTHHPQTLGKCERLWSTVGTELWDRAHPEDLSEARERLGHFFAHYNFFRPHQGIEGLVPADRFFGAESALRTTLEAQLAADELGAALGEPPRRSVYLFGQIGDRQVSLHGERGRLVVHTGDGESMEIDPDELGAGGAAPLVEHEEVPCDAQTDSDGVGVERDAAGDEHDDGRGSAGAAAPDAAVPQAGEGGSAAAPGACGAGAVEACEPGGARGGAPQGRLGALDVAGPQGTQRGGAGAVASAAACVAAQPDGALRYAGGPSQAAAPLARQGGGLDERGREPQPSAQADRRAGAGEPGPEGGPGADHADAQAGGEPVDAEENGGRGRQSGPEADEAHGQGSWPEPGSGSQRPCWGRDDSAGVKGPA